MTALSRPPYYWLWLSSSVSDPAHALWSQVVASKFQYVVSSQVYGKNRKAADVRGRWLAEGIDVLLEVG